MRSIIRKIIGAGLVLGACGLAFPVEAQSPSKKKARKPDPVAEVNARRAHVKLHELCEDGVWSIHVSNPCMRHGGFAARQTEPPPAPAPRPSAKVKGRVIVKPAVRRSGSGEARAAAEPIGR